MQKKAFLEISFGWMFALIVGGFILFIAIYFITNFKSGEDSINNAKLSKDIGILINPLEIGYEESKVNVIDLPTITQINNDCTTIGNFGEQLISTSHESFGKQTDEGVKISFQNKYLFSNNSVVGKKFYLFSKSLNYPFKAADLTYLISADEDYCFVNAPKEITQEIIDLNLPNFFNETNSRNCDNKSKIVCFNQNSNSCNIKVDTYQKIVSKNSQTLYFDEDALMYAAIFANKNIYDCQTKRLMKRIIILSKIYEEKGELIRGKNCYTSLNLDGLRNYANGFYGDFSKISLVKKDIEIKNSQSICRLW